MLYTLFMSTRYSTKRQRVNSWVCDAVENGNLEELRVIAKVYPLKKIKTSFNGLNLLCIAPHRHIASLLIEEGVDQEDQSGQLLGVCYDDVAQMLTERNNDIRQAVHFLQHPPCSLSPTSRRFNSERLANLLRWKEEVNQQVKYILVEECNIIKDLAGLILSFL